MYPHERSLVKRLAGSPFALLGINSDRDREALAKVLEEQNITWRSWWNHSIDPETGEKVGGTATGIALRWNVTSWPTIYVLDSLGRIRYKGVRGEALDDAIDTLLGEMGAPIPPRDSKSRSEKGS